MNNASLHAWGFDTEDKVMRGIRLRIHDKQIVLVESSIDTPSYSLFGTEINTPEPGDDVCIGLPGIQCLSRFTKMPPVEPRKVCDIVQYEAVQMIPFELDDVYWTSHIFTSDDSPDAELGIFAVKKEIAHEYIEIWEKKKVNVLLLQPAPIAILNALWHDNHIGGEGLNNVTLILIINANDMELVIYGSDHIWMRSIPLGYMRLVDCLEKSFKLSASKALNLLFTSEESEDKQQIVQKTRPVINELNEEIQRLIHFYCSTHLGNTICNIIQVGSGGSLYCLKPLIPRIVDSASDSVRIEFQDFLSEDTYPIPAIFNDPIRDLEELAELTDQRIDIGPRGVDNPSAYWAAYGLALAGLNQEKLDINLMPQKGLKLGEYLARGFGHLYGLRPRISVIELLVIVAIIGLLSVTVAALFSKSSPLHPVADRAVITIESSPEGDFHISTEYEPEFDLNIRAHREALKMLREKP